jgi:hypothetical protein
MGLVGPSAKTGGLTGVLGVGGGAILGIAIGVDFGIEAAGVVAVGVALAV